MIKNIYSLILFFVFTVLSGQNETKNWYFGNNCGLTFTPAATALSNGGMATNEGCSTISDASGNLLFYTDGVTVWNKLHAMMTNGNGLLGDLQSTQSALIVKKPGSADIYYIFTVPADGIGNFCYSTVDMSLSTGNGSVVLKNVVISGTVTEKLSAVHHCNGTDIWVLTHGMNTNSFYSYSVSATGINTVAVVSSVGPVYKEAGGQMKFNNSGTRVACSRDTVITLSPYAGKTYLDLYQFNDQTGAVSSPTVVQLNNWQKGYGVEFSRDNSKVYATRYDVNGINGGNSEVVQYDMNAANTAASGGTVAVQIGDILRALQLGSDGNIYVAKGATPFVNVLANTNAAAASVTYTDNFINIDPLSNGNLCMLGLPGFVTSYFDPAFPAIATCTTSTNTAVVDLQGMDIMPGAIFDNASEQLVITAADAQKGIYNVTVTDISGREVFETKVEINSGNDNKRISLPGLSPGIYIARTSNTRSSVSTKFIKH